MRLFFTAIIILTFFGCSNQQDDYHKPEDALDAGREFIQQSLKGKFSVAEKYMLQDQDNQYWLAKWINEFNKISERERASYAKASINIAEVSDIVPDSVTVINFTNSYKKIPQKLKVVKYNGEWKVDFKYTFSGNL